MTRQQLPKPANDDNKQRQLRDKLPGQESVLASLHEAGSSPTLRRLAVQYYARHHGNRAAIQRYGLQDRIRGSSSSPAAKSPASGTGAGGAGSPPPGDNGWLYITRLDPSASPGAPAQQWLWRTGASNR